MKNQNPKAMTTNEIFNIGFEEGKSIAQMNEPQISDMFEQSETKEQFKEDCLGMLQNITDHSRQFSPFELFAKEINESDKPEKLWESYEDGLTKGFEFETNKFIECGNLTN